MREPDFAGLICGLTQLPGLVKSGRRNTLVFMWSLVRLFHRESLSHGMNLWQRRRTEAAKGEIPLFLFRLAGTMQLNHGLH